MSLENKKSENVGNKVMVEVNVANIVKSVCVTSVIIVSIVFGSKLITKFLDLKSSDTE